MSRSTMSRSTMTEDGVIDTVFAHRFVLRRHDGTRLLADLGPEGPKTFSLVEGAEVSIEGDVKPSELKVVRITPKGGVTVTVARHEPGVATTREIAVCATALAAVRESGLVPLAEPRRKPKHCEVLARRGEDLVEVHVDRDGNIRKETVADLEKWASVVTSIF